MSSSDRREDEVRRMLDVRHTTVPPDLLQHATERGNRLLRRHRALRRAGWLLLFLAVIAFLAWASVAEPWVVPPSKTTPPLEGW
ncbi:MULTISPECIES: hypothetical protein [unclassified Streptomyces]|uniref:hypothetical protein n=1 Tax=unclassified Streptomyces TaxID=2593676 RepID=UPI003648F0F2